MWQLGQPDNARAALAEALCLADAFDAQPNYDSRALRFLQDAESHSLYDDLGTTARVGIENTLRSLDNNTLFDLWKEMTDHGTDSH